MNTSEDKSEEIVTDKVTSKRSRMEEEITTLISPDEMIEASKC